MQSDKPDEPQWLGMSCIPIRSRSTSGRFQILGLDRHPSNPG